MTRGAAAHSRWLYLLAAAPPIVAILTLQLAPSSHDHWSDHLSSAGFKSAQLVLLIVLLTMLGWRTLSPVMAVAPAVVGAGIVLQVIGDFRGADSIWRTAVDPESGPCSPSTR